jgi:hypothetical protein
MRARAAAKFLLPLLLLGVAVAGFGYLKSTKPSQPKPRRAERSWVVETVAAQPGQFAPSLTLYGKVEAPTLLQPAAPGAGIVSEVRVPSIRRAPTCWIWKRRSLSWRYAANPIARRWSKKNACWRWHKTP